MMHCFVEWLSGSNSWYGTLLTCRRSRSVHFHRQVSHTWASDPDTRITKPRTYLLWLLRSCRIIDVGAQHASFLSLIRGNSLGVCVTRRLSPSSSHQTVLYPLANPAVPRCKHPYPRGTHTPVLTFTALEVSSSTRGFPGSTSPMPPRI